MISSTALTTLDYVQKFTPERVFLVPDLVRKFSTEYSLEDGACPDLIELGKPLRVSAEARKVMRRYLSEIRKLAKPGVRVHWLVNSECIHIMRSLPGARSSSTIGYEYRRDIEMNGLNGLYRLIAALIYLDRLYCHNRVTGDLVADCVMLGHINYPETRVDPMLSQEHLLYMERNLEILPDLEAMPFKMRYHALFES
jgi:hypothetical protein